MLLALGRPRVNCPRNSNYETVILLHVANFNHRLGIARFLRFGSKANDDIKYKSVRLHASNDDQPPLMSETQRHQDELALSGATPNR